MNSIVIKKYRFFSVGLTKSGYYIKIKNNPDTKVGSEVHIDMSEKCKLIKWLCCFFKFYQPIR